MSIIITLLMLHPLLYSTPGANLLVDLLRMASFHNYLRIFFKIIVFRFVSILSFYFSLLFEKICFYCVPSINRIEIELCRVLI